MDGPYERLFGLGRVYRVGHGEFRDEGNVVGRLVLGVERNMIQWVPVFRSHLDSER